MPSKAKDDQITIFRAYVPEEQRQDGIYRAEYLVEVLRAFFYKVGEHDAPLRAMQRAEQLVMFNKRDVVECFLGRRIKLLNPCIPAGEYIVRRQYKVVLGGVYKTLYPGDILDLSEAEAEALVRAQIVESCDPRAFKL